MMHSDPRQALAAVRAEVAKAVVGQDQLVTGLLIALVADGHVLLEGVPGVAKTLLARTVAATLSLSAKRPRPCLTLVVEFVTIPATQAELLPVPIRRI